MHVLVASVSGEFFNGTADAVSLPSELGELTILPHHQALVSVLARGRVSVMHENETSTVAITSGVLEVSDKGNVSVLIHIDTEQDAGRER